MKTREAFIEENMGEMTYLLIVSLVTDHKPAPDTPAIEMNRRGNAFLGQLRNARGLLARMYDQLHPPAQKPAIEPKPAATNGATPRK